MTRPTETIIMTKKALRGVWKAADCALVLSDYQEHMLDAVWRPVLLIVTARKEQI